MCVPRCSRPYSPLNQTVGAPSGAENLPHVGCTLNLPTGSAVPNTPSEPSYHLFEQMDFQLLHEV